MQGNKIGVLGYIMESFGRMKQEALLGLQMETDGVFKTKWTWQEWMIFATFEIETMSLSHE